MTLVIAFAPAVVIAACYRSWQLGAITAVTSSVGALLGFFGFMRMETLLGAAGTAADGTSSTALLGLSVGWIVGIALPLWIRRGGVAAAERPLPQHVVVQDAEILAARSGDSAGSSRDPFDCTRYTYAELCEAAEHINRAKYPERARRLDEEIVRRNAGDREA